MDELKVSDKFRAIFGRLMAANADLDAIVAACAKAKAKADQIKAELAQAAVAEGLAPNVPHNFEDGKYCVGLNDKGRLYLSQMTRLT